MKRSLLPVLILLCVLCVEAPPFAGPEEAIEIVSVAATEGNMKALAEIRADVLKAGSGRVHIVATPADLPAPGWPELEAGMQWAKGGDTARSQSSPVTFKLAWNEGWAILIGTDIYDWQRAYEGGTAHSGGDTTLTSQVQIAGQRQRCARSGTRRGTADRASADRIRESRLGNQQYCQFRLPRNPR